MELELKLKKLEGIFFTGKYRKQKMKLSEISKEIEKEIEETLKTSNKKLPNAILYNEFQMQVSLSDFIENKLSLIFFYRGSWCPYSNINLEYLMNHSYKLKEKGYNILAISNSLPREDMGLGERVNLPISVLIDTESSFSENLGLTYDLTKELKTIYNKAGITPNTGGSNKIIFPTIFLVDTDRNVENIIIREDEMYIEDIERFLV